MRMPIHHTKNNVVTCCDDNANVYAGIDPTLTESLSAHEGVNIPFNPDATARANAISSRLL